MITKHRSNLPSMWLSATEGDKNGKLARLDHWPETEVFKNETKKLEAVETVWRDFYTGQRLDKWTKPYQDSKEDTIYGGDMNCMLAATKMPWDKSWSEWECHSYDMSCPCSYPTQPLLRLRGLCSTSIDNLFSPKQLPGNPGNMILLGDWSTRIEYYDTSRQWVLTSAKYNVRARATRPTKPSFPLGKHNWTISNDVYECNEGKTYTAMLKLTGCKEEGDFTCGNPH